jgi:hypothetical protein
MSIKHTFDRFGFHLSFNALVFKTILNFFSTSSFYLYIFPTNPHQYFFTKSLFQRPVQLVLNLFLQNSALVYKPLTRKLLFPLLPTCPPGAQVRFLSIFAGYGQDMGNKVFNYAKSLLQAHLQAKPLEILNIFSLVLRIFASYFHRLYFPGYTFLLQTTSVGTPVNLCLSLVPADSPLQR